MAVLEYDIGTQKIKTHIMQQAACSRVLAQKLCIYHILALSKKICPCQALRMGLLTATDHAPALSRRPVSDNFPVPTQITA